MPIRVVIDHAASLVRSTITDPVTLADLDAARVRLVRSEDFMPTLRHLIDVREITSASAFGKREIETLASWETLFAPQTLQVVVARDGTPMFALVRWFQAVAHGTGRNVHLVASLEKADALLGD